MHGVQLTSEPTPSYPGLQLSCRMASLGKHYLLPRGTRDAFILYVLDTHFTPMGGNYLRIKHPPRTTSSRVTRPGGY